MVAVWLPKSVQLTETYGRQRERGCKGVGKNKRRKGDWEGRLDPFLSVNQCRNKLSTSTFNASIYSFRWNGLVRD